MKIEQYERAREERICKRLDRVVWALLLIGFVLLIAAVIHTQLSFVPQFRAFMEAVNG